MVAIETGSSLIVQNRKRPLAARPFSGFLLGWKVMWHGLVLKCHQPFEQQWRIRGTSYARRAGNARIARGHGEHMDALRDGILEFRAHRVRVLNKPARRLIGTNYTRVVKLGRTLREFPALGQIKVA
jgi:hypothetical protein